MWNATKLFFSWNNQLDRCHTNANMIDMYNQLSHARFGLISLCALLPNVFQVS